LKYIRRPKSKRHRPERREDIRLAGVTKCKRKGEKRRIFVVEALVNMAGFS